MSIIDRIRNYFMGKRQNKYNNMSDGNGFYTYDNTMVTDNDIASGNYFQQHSDTTHDNRDDSYDYNDDTNFDSSDYNDSGSDSSSDSGGDSGGSSD